MLPDYLVQELRDAYAQGETVQNLCDDYDITRTELAVALMGVERRQEI